jgi:hypothetical protein
MTKKGQKVEGAVILFSTRRLYPMLKTTLAKGFIGNTLSYSIERKKSKINVLFR